MTKSVSHATAQGLACSQIGAQWGWSVCPPN